MWLPLHLENIFKMHTSCLHRGYMAADAKEKEEDSVDWLQVFEWTRNNSMRLTL